MMFQEYIQNYLNWLESQYSHKQLDEAIEITTPLINSIGDNLRIYIEETSNNRIRLSDDGVTLEDLELMGLDISTKTREDIIKNVLLQYKISIDDNDNTLYIDGSKDDFPLMKFNLTNAMQKINDLVFTKKSTVDNLFFEEAFDYFKENDFRGIKNGSFLGGSGVDHRINYTIPESSKSPMSLIALQNKSVDRQSIMLNGFIYDDIRKNNDYKNANFSIIYNSNSKISDNVNKLAESANISLIPWSNKEEILSLKTA